MNTGRVTISLLLALAGLITGCSYPTSTQQPAAQTILSADELESMIRVEMREIRPTEADAIIAAYDQP